MSLVLGYILAWTGLAILAVLNGLLRDKGYGPLLTELRGHQVSTIIALGLFSLYVWWLSGRWPLASAAQALGVGIAWLVLTLAFEFLFGHYVAGHSWDRLLQDYHFTKGRLWVLVPLWTAVAPYAAYRLRS